MKTTPVKGCLDYLPKDMELRGQVIEKILEAYKKNGFLQVKTPVLENLENLTSGDTGDNNKWMFKTVKRGAKLDLTKPNLTEDDIVEEGLRYDLTVPLARLFTKNRNDLTFPFKSIQIDDSFRAEKPQEGRNRQFTQCDIDIWGEPTVLGEIEIITTIMEAYKNVGIPDVVCKISSRKILNSILLWCGFEQSSLKDVCIIIDKLDKIGLDGCKNELAAMGFNEKPINALAKAILAISDSGLQSCAKFGVAENDVKEVSEIINVVSKFIPQNYQIKFDISIVRGQGYYTGAVFEMYCPSSGFRGAIGGGGRYDKMYYRFAGQDVPAVGYGLGLDSVLLVLSKLGITNLSGNKKLALVYRQEEPIENIMQIKNNFKKEYDVSLFPFPKNFKEFLRRAKLNGFDYFAKTDKQIVEEI